MTNENTTPPPPPSGEQPEGLHSIRVIADPRYYEALLQIVQDAQASGSVVQIVTIFPSASTRVSDLATSLDCMPSGACPK